MYGDVCNLIGNIEGLISVTPSPPCWSTVNKRFFMVSFVKIHLHGRNSIQCHLNLWELVAYAPGCKQSLNKD